MQTTIVVKSFLNLGTDVIRVSRICLFARDILHMPGIDNEKRDVGGRSFKDFVKGGPIFEYLTPKPLQTNRTYVTIFWKAVN